MRTLDYISNLFQDTTCICVHAPWWMHQCKCLRISLNTIPINFWSNFDTSSGLMEWNHWAQWEPAPHRTRRSWIWFGIPVWSLNVLLCLHRFLPIVIYTFNYNMYSIWQVFLFRSQYICALSSIRKHTNKLALKLRAAMILPEMR